MKKCRKVLSLLMSVWMVFSLFAGMEISSFAADEDLLTYRIDGDSVTITGCDQSFSGELVIPDTIEGYPVTQIENEAFFNCYDLTDITIPSTMIYIGDGAFRDCSNLTNVVLQNGLITISSNVFNGCSSLTKIDMPESMRYIGDYAFANCPNLADLSIPAGIIQIGKNIVYGSSKVTSISVAEANETYCDIDGVLFSKDKTELLQYPFGRDAKSYSVPECAKSIGTSAFFGCENLTKIVVHDGVTAIREDAFCNCSNLADILLGDGIAQIEKEVFYNTGYYNEESNWYNGILYIGKYLIQVKNDFNGRCDMQEGTKCIADYAFAYCLGLQEITVPNSVQYIGDCAFWNCRNLQEIELPDTIVTIGESAFSGCESLTEIVIGENVENIGEEAFASCTALESIAIQNNITKIGRNAFYNTKYYNTESNWVDNVLYIGSCLIRAKTDISGSYSVKEDTVIVANGAFAKCGSLRSVVLPDSVTYIGSAAFSSCPELRDIRLSENISVIETSTFADCVNLAEISIPDSVTSIGDMAFHSCHMLSDVEFPEHLTAIGFQAFYDCYTLKNIVLPDSITSMAPYAFWRCLSLETVHISSGLTVLEDDVFSQCFHLKNVEIPDTVTTIREHVFASCAFLDKIIIPESVTVIDTGAFSNCYGLQNIIVQGKNTELSESELGLIECEFHDVSAKEIGAKFGEYADVLVAYVKGEISDEEVEAALMPILEWLEENIVELDTPVVNPDVVMSGWRNSTAEAYAKEHGIRFLYLDDPASCMHRYGEWTQIIAPTCTVSGTQTRICALCGDVQQKEIPALGHTPVKVAGKAPTCSSAGCSDGEICSVCGVVLSGKETLEPTAHSFGAWIVLKEATCTQTGTETRTCTRCGQTENRVIPINDNHTDRNHDGICDDCGYDNRENCDCYCHQLNKFTKIILKLARVLWKLFGIDSLRYCDCGTAHW